MTDQVDSEMTGIVPVPISDTPAPLVDEIAAPSATGRSSTTPANHDIASEAGSNADSGINILGYKVKALVQAVDKLQSLGIETKDLPLPKIVVVGDQSAGKSSLIEGISGIKVPRSSGTCTRCPLQISLTPTDSADDRWSCTITLQKHYDYYSSPALDERGKPSPFGNWREKYDPDEVVFAQTYDRSALEELIRRAQFACLNPGDKPARYLDALYVSELPLRVPFSPNIVRLEIREPGSPSLSFVDLPGVINQTEVAADKWLVRFVKALVKAYVSNPNTLVLLACSMESDMANSRASKIVEDCAGAKERCVGVLTKPDRRPADSQFEDVRKVLAGQTFTVGHGYFVAMQPSQLMLDTGISADEARLQEAHFFAQEPWSNTLKDFQHRFGTSQLQIALSRKLADQIRKSLPDISDRIDARLAHVDLDLQNYPDPPANALGHIIEALTLFKTSTERHLEGSFPHNEFRNDVKKVAVSFREALKDLKPTLKVATPEGFLPNGPAATVNLLSEDEDEDMNDIASHEGRHTPCAVATSTPTSNKKRKVDIESSSATDRLKMLNMRSNPRPKFKEIAQRVFTLMEIRSTLENLTMSDIPGEIDPRAVDHLRSECLTGWKGPMDKFLHDIAIILKDKLGQVFHETCGKWSATEFYRETKKMVDSFIDVTMSEERAHACRALQLELFKPLTLNNEDIDKKQKEELERIEAVRYRKRAIEYLDRTEQRTGRITSGADRSKKIQNDKTLRMSLGADVFQKEIEVMSRVCGYYRVAMFRFLDRVVQETQHGLEQCRSGLHQQLLLGLEIGNENAHEHCTRLLLEDPLREAQRIALKNERQKLVEAQERLSRLDIPEIE